MRNLLITYTIILALGIGAMVTQIHYLANIAGFIGAIGLMLVFFKDRPDEETLSPEQQAHNKKMRRYWYIVFITGIVFSLIFGSLWNSHMGRMV
ncbi:hypothetical protein [Thiomicrospira sp. WB1]|uniref:hypothetical protein n=1 Tax=Thiomicrospira sp. WB1 TaxID=1685380 RepID=UPI000747A658|nr:hypothetical protein [Thiomicrospira sp. WB1]KUJ71889.1 hypothetical protein AVO41_05390 [Thiomicrospira sp. WB1]